MKFFAPLVALLCFTAFRWMLVGYVPQGTLSTEVISLPSGYIGWVRSDYGVQGAKSIPLKNNRCVFATPPSGYLKTSSLPIQGVTNEELEYVHGTTRIPIDVTSNMWDDGVGGVNGKFSQRTFFVGIKAQSELAYKVDLPTGNVSANSFLAWAKGRDLTYQNLSGHQFLKANLKGTNTSSTILQKANFQKANLSYAILSGDNTSANFQGAHLHGAILIDGLFMGADLRDCDLRMASLQGVDLSQAKIQGANFSNAKYDARTKWPRGFNVRKHGLLLRPLVLTQN